MSGDTWSTKISSATLSLSQQSKVSNSGTIKYLGLHCCREVGFPHAEDQGAVCVHHVHIGLFTHRASHLCHPKASTAVAKMIGSLYSSHALNASLVIEHIQLLSLMHSTHLQPNDKQTLPPTPQCIFPVSNHPRHASSFLPHPPSSQFVSFCGLVGQVPRLG